MKTFRAKIGENHEITLQAGFPLMKQVRAVGFGGTPKDLIWLDAGVVPAGEKVVYHCEPGEKEGRLIFRAPNGTTDDQALVALRGHLQGVKVLGGHELA